MILAIDIGNTNIVVGCIDEQETCFVERISTSTDQTTLEYAITFKNILELYHINPKGLEGAIISSVVPNISNTVRRSVEKVIGKPCLLVGPGVKTGLNIQMDNPATVGSDLVVTAVAGIKEYKAPFVVIDMGTATTITCVDKNHNDIGGAIMPGVRVSGIPGPACRSASQHQSGNAEACHREKHHRLYAQRNRIRKRCHARRHDRPVRHGAWRASDGHRHRRSFQSDHPALPS